MRLVTLSFACVFGLASCAHLRPGGERITEYRGGAWFNGQTFVPRTMWVSGQRLATERPGQVDAVVELDGGFVVPPYAEGHTHWLEPALVEQYIGASLRAGIFYVKDMSTPVSVHDAMRARLSTPPTVEYVAAHQGLTGPGGHPLELIDQLAQMGIFSEAAARNHGEGDAVFVVATEQDIERVWPRLLEGRPAFVKLFLAHADEYAARRDDPKQGPKGRGIDPALVPGIVRRAHAAHLRVTAHVESAFDVHVALMAGVDDLAHLPFVDRQHPEQYRISDDDISEAARRRVSASTTSDFLDDAKAGDPQVVVARDNIKRLLAAGVPVTIGTDLFRQDAHVEAERLAALGLMSNRELLETWTMTTPRAIFPARDLGRFGDGAEASFLVLAGDPLVDFAQTRHIVRWIKEGVALSPPDIKLP